MKHGRLLSITPEKVGPHKMEIRVDGRAIGTVQGEVFKTIETKKFRKNVLNEKTGRYEEKIVEEKTEGTVNSMIEKTKAIVEWMTTQYKPMTHGELSFIDPKHL
ncbi:MAG: hypothetical protein ACTSSP_00470 [Candidatus Asgardarchaeia archaeon]